VIWVLGVAWVLVVVALAVLALWRARARGRMTPSARRILFPFIGDKVSQSALDAVLRIARAESATLIPAYIVTVPLYLELEAPLPSKCGPAMPLLEAIEQRAASVGVPVETRIQSGRSARHALRQLLDEERFDRLVVPAATHGHNGFGPEDIAWLLEQAPGEIVVLRGATDRAPAVADLRPAA
jgi:nucleotide-binding universal stress UspA family protein